MKYILFLFVFCCGCYTEQKAKKEFNKAALNYPVIPAEYCASVFPSQDSIVVRDSIRRDTVLELSFFTDTFTVDSIRYVVKTQTKYITKTVTKDSIIYRNNPAEERRLQLALTACQGNNNDLLAKFTDQTEKLESWQGKAKKRFWLLIFIAGAGAAYAGIRIYNAFKPRVNA